MSFRMDAKDPEKTVKHTNTGKYNMPMLRELSRLEEAAHEELAVMYNVETADDLPVDFNVHEILDIEIDDRRNELKCLLSECPVPTDEFIDKYLDKLKIMNPKLA